MVGAGVVGFGAGAVTVWVTVGAATGAFAEPHAARLIPAANAMAGIAITLLNFMSCSPPSPESLISPSVNESLRTAHEGT